MTQNKQPKTIIATKNKTFGSFKLKVTEIFMWLTLANNYKSKRINM